MNTNKKTFPRDRQYFKFSLYGFLKNQKFFDPFMILFFREGGASFFEIGALYSIREIATNILEIPTGVFADTFGRRMSMILCFVSYILSFLVFYFFKGFIIYGFAMVIFAVGEAFRTGTHKAMILEYLRLNNLLDYKVDYYGHTRGWSQTGSAVSSVIAALLVFYSGRIELIFPASIIPYLIALLLILSYPKELDGEICTANDSSKAAPLESIKNTVADFIGVFKDRELIKAITNSSIFDAMFKALKDYLQPLLKSYALILPVFASLDQSKRVSVAVGAVYFFLYMFTSFAARSSGSISGKSGTLEGAININYLLGSVFILLSGVSFFFDYYVFSVLFFILFYVIENIKKPMNVGYISEIISHRVMATGLSVESQLKTILAAVVAPVMGLIADKAGIGAGLIVMGCFLFLIYPLISLGGKK